jgi:hypothetical protein
MFGRDGSFDALLRRHDAAIARFIYAATIFLIVVSAAVLGGALLGFALKVI